jgi:porin
MRVRLVIGIGLVAALASGTAAQQGDTRAGLARLADSSRSGFVNEGTFGGPETIGAELEVSDQVKEPYFRVPVRVFRPWFDFKGRVREKTGIQFGVNYTAYYLAASAGIEETSQTSAASGIIDIPVSWTAWGAASGNPGTFALKFENRHVYGSRPVSPMFLGFETGSILLPATKANEFTFRFWELNFQQRVLDNRAHVTLGKIDPTNYYTFHGLIHPFMNFYGYGNSVSPTANWPNSGAGVIAAVFPTEQIYVMAGLHDAAGDRLESGDLLDFGNQFFEGTFFKAVEVGYTPGYGEHYFKKISALYWHADEYANSPQGSGVAFTAHWFFEEKFIPFASAGFSDGNGANALAKSSVTLGHGYRFKSHDILGTSLNWTRPPGGLRDQYTAEVYYRVTLTERLAITPDVQWVINPSLNADRGSLFYFGVRARVTM